MKKTTMYIVRYQHGTVFLVKRSPNYLEISFETHIVLAQFNGF